MTVIPPRAPVGDPFAGCLSRIDDRCILSADPVPGADVVARSVILRYGARFLEKPVVSIVPGLIALERGELMTGMEAWDFLLHSSQLFPRTEVYGYRDDGTDDMRLVRTLDFAITPKVLAYADEAATVPLAEVHALIGDAAGVPALAREYLPVYGTLDDFPR